MTRGRATAVLAAEWLGEHRTGSVVECAEDIERRSARDRRAIMRTFVNVLGAVCVHGTYTLDAGEAARILREHAERGARVHAALAEQLGLQVAS